MAFTENIRIVILQRGFVYVGFFVQKESQCQLLRAYNIRKWGTTKGLGELAENGPTKNTILDKCGGTVRFHELTIIATIDCEEKWGKILL